MSGPASGLMLRGLHASLGGRAVLHGLDLDAAAGAVTALIGANGAGKSTVLRAVLGLIPSTGTVRLGSIDLVAQSPTQRAQSLAYVPQRSRLQAGLTVESVVAMGRYARQDWLARLSAADQAAVDAAMSDAGAADLMGRRFDRLSVGEQQRVLLARALATGAPVLLLDEPTAGLDLAHALRLLERLRALAAAGRTVVVVLHHLDEVRACADAVALLADGRVVDHGVTDAVLGGEAVRRALSVEPVAGAGGWRLTRAGP